MSSVSDLNSYDGKVIALGALSESWESLFYRSLEVQARYHLCTYIWIRGGIALEISITTNVFQSILLHSAVDVMN